MQKGFPLHQSCCENSLPLRLTELMLGLGGRVASYWVFLDAVLFHDVKHDQKVKFSVAGTSGAVPDLFCWRQRCFLANHSCLLEVVSSPAKIYGVWDV